LGEKIDDVPNGAGKTHIWLEVAMTTKVRQKEWQKAENERRIWKQGNDWFFFFFKTLASNCFMLKAWNPPLFIRGGRGIFYFFFMKNLGS